MKKLLFAALAATLLLTACKKKSEDAAPITFGINGIHDLALNSGSHNYLYLTVTNNENASQERVTLSVTGLPNGVTVTISPESGVPEFHSTIDFFCGRDAIPGTYPVKIKGTAASGSRSFDLNITVPPFNGFYAAGVRYATSVFTFDPFYLYIESSDNGGAWLFCDSSDPLPVANGTYVYVLSRTSGSGLMQLEYDFPGNPGRYNIPAGPSTATATLRVQDGKYSVEFQDIELVSSSLATDRKVIRASVHSF